MRAAIVTLLLLGGCAGSGPRIESGTFDGPPLAVDSTGPRHTIILTAPTAGWSITLDRARLGYDQTDVFVTITRPDPAAMHAQVVTTLRLDSSVESARRLQVYARTNEFRAKSGSTPYRVRAVEPPKSP